MDGVIVNFNDMKKSDRSEYINGIWGINQILKNTFLSFYLDNQGRIFSDKLNKLEIKTEVLRELLEKRK